MTGAVTRKTYYARWASGTGTAQINAAIVNAAANGFTVVALDAEMVPYDATAVVFNTAIQMTCEGGDASANELLAYGGNNLGSVDNHAAFVAAFGASAVNRRPVTLSFSGSYLLNSTVTLTTVPQFEGNYRSGALTTGVLQGPTITGNFNGPMFDITGAVGAHYTVIRGLRFVQQNTGTSASCLRFSPGVEMDIGDISNCSFDSAGHGVLITGTLFSANVWACDFTGHSTTGSIGLFVSGHADVRGCQFTFWDHGIRNGNDGGAPVAISGCRFEVNTVGIFTGQDASGTSILTLGPAITGCSFEANDTAIYFFRAHDFSLVATQIKGTSNAPSGASIYGLRLQEVTEGLISSTKINGSGGFTTAGVYIADSGAHQHITFIGIISTAAPGAGANWVLPTGAAAVNYSGVELIGCNAGSPVMQMETGATPNVYQDANGAGQLWTVTNTGATTITNISGGVVGKPTMIQATNGNTTLKHGTNIFLKSGADKTLITNETITLMQFTAGRWDEI